MLLYLLFTRKTKAMEPTLNTETKQVDAYLSLLTTINKGIVELLGPASKGLIFGTGVEEGKRLAIGLEKTDTIQKAIKTLNDAYHGVWGIELHHKEGDSYFYMDELGQPSFNIMVDDGKANQEGYTEKDWFGQVPAVARRFRSHQRGVHKELSGPRDRGSQCLRFN